MAIAGTENIFNSSQMFIFETRQNMALTFCDREYISEEALSMDGAIRAEVDIHEATCTDDTGG